MRKWMRAWARTFLLALSTSLVLVSTVGGCGSGNPNEDEFLQNAPRGTPPENPNETFRERKERLHKAAQEIAKEKASQKGPARAPAKRS
jgi:hypothetical protein